VLAAMNGCFYEAIARLPLSTVSAIEFLPVIARLLRETYSLMVSLLPATATVVGLLVLGPDPEPATALGDLAGGRRARAAS
jgi:inner membrane transporter RhtA